jgi:hypothetical protein
MDPIDAGSIRTVQGPIPHDRGSTHDRSARCKGGAWMDPIDAGSIRTVQGPTRTTGDRPTIDPHGAKVDPRSIPAAEAPDHDRSLLDRDRSTIDRA